jgi:transposase-like protein
MKYRKWDPKAKAKIVLECLEGKVPISEICNKYGIRQSVFAYWLKAFEQKGYQVFESGKRSKKEQKLKDENEKLKKIIAELSIDLKKTEIELAELEGEDL